MNDRPYRDSFHLPLTREEVENRAADLVALMDERDSIERDLDTVKKEAKTKVDGLEKQIAILAIQVRTKSDLREVECVDRLDSEGLTVETLDVQTGRILKMRPALPHERQLRLVTPDRQVERED